MTTDDSRFPQTFQCQKVSTPLYVTSPRMFTVSEVVARAGRGEFLVPDLQRSFVWQVQDICYAVESLLRGWPLGSFVLWQSPAKRPASLLVGKRAFWYAVPPNDSSVGESFRQPRPDDILDQDMRYLVLDGQQRIQTLLLAFANGCLLSRSERDWRKYVQNNGKTYRSRAYVDKDELWRARLYINVPALSEALHSAGSLNNVALCDRSHADDANDLPLVWAHCEEVHRHSAYTTTTLWSESDWISSNGIALDKLWESATSVPSKLDALLDNYCSRQKAGNGVDESDLCAWLDALRSLGERLREVAERVIPHVEIRERLPEEDEADYNNAVVTIFARLNQGGVEVTEAQVTYAFLARGWGAESDGVAKAFEPLRTNEYLSSLTLDQLVRLVTNVWSARFGVDGELITSEYLMDGGRSTRVAAGMKRDWNALKSAVVGMTEASSPIRELVWGDHYRSINPLCVVAACWPFDADDLGNGLDGQNLRKWLKKNSAELVLKGQLVSYWTNDRLASRLKQIRSAHVGQRPYHAIEKLLQGILEDIRRACDIDLDQFRSTPDRNVRRYYHILRSWHWLYDFREAARLEVDHVIPVEHWNQLAREFGQPEAGLENRLGNCTLLAKTFNCSKGKKDFDEFLHGQGLDEEDRKNWLSRLAISEVLCSPRRFMKTGEWELVKQAVQKRESQILNELKQWSPMQRPITQPSAAHPVRAERVQANQV